MDRIDFERHFLFFLNKGKLIRKGCPALEGSQALGLQQFPPDHTQSTRGLQLPESLSVSVCVLVCPAITLYTF